MEFGFNGIDLLRDPLVVDGTLAAKAITCAKGIFLLSFMIYPIKQALRRFSFFYGVLNHFIMNTKKPAFCPCVFNHHLNNGYILNVFDQDKLNGLTNFHLKVLSSFAYDSSC